MSKHFCLFSHKNPSSVAFKITSRSKLDSFVYARCVVNFKGFSSPAGKLKDFMPLTFHTI